MITLEQACRKHAETAFEIAIKNCIRPAKKGQRREVKISETDSHKLVDFYRRFVKDERDAALIAIGKASRRAGGKSPLIPVAIFLIALMFVLLVAFNSLWPIMGALLAAVIVIYIWWKRRRTAQKFWAARKTFKRGTDEALERMCQVLAMPFYSFASLPLLGALAAGVIVCVYQTIKLYV